MKITILFNEDSVKYPGFDFLFYPVKITTGLFVKKTKIYYPVNNVYVTKAKTALCIVYADKETGTSLNVETCLKIKNMHELSNR